MLFAYCKEVALVASLVLVSLLPQTLCATILPLSAPHGLLLDSGGLLLVYGKNEDRQHVITCQANEVGGLCFPHHQSNALKSYFTLFPRSFI